MTVQTLSVKAGTRSVPIFVPANTVVTSGAQSGGTILLSISSAPHRKFTTIQRRGLLGLMDMQLEHNGMFAKSGYTFEPLRPDLMDL